MYMCEGERLFVTTSDSEMLTAGCVLYRLYIPPNFSWCLVLLNLSKLLFHECSKSTFTSPKTYS